MRNPAFCICINKDVVQLLGQRLYFRFINSTLYPQFQESNHLLWQYSPVGVESGRKPRGQGSHDAAHVDAYLVTAYTFVIHVRLILKAISEHQSFDFCCQTAKLDLRIFSQEHFKIVVISFQLKHCYCTLKKLKSHFIFQLSTCDDDVN